MPRTAEIGRKVVALVISAIVLSACGGPEQAPVKVTIASTPDSGADVMIRGVHHGLTPTTIETLLPGEAVYVHLDKEGYKHASKMIRVPEEGEARFVIPLKPRVGYITVTSRPEGAKVLIDGSELMGRTPVAHQPLLVGEHTYEIRLEDYERVRRTIEVEEDYRYAFNHVLKPLDARLSVFSRPTAAHIWINEEAQDEQTPARFSLSPGTYTISVHAKGYITAENTVVLEPNEERTVELTMKEGDAPPGMALIPAGDFIMGVDGASPDERPQRTVFVDAFYMDKYEVTNLQYKVVFLDHTYEEGMDSLPVAGVSYIEAEAYAQAVGKRLPTEAEWEKAARGTDGREYPWGNEFDPDKCNTARPYASGPTRVGKFRAGASPYGCVDMAGNVYEWTSSWYRAYPGNEDIRAEYGQEFKVLRGGSYRTSQFEVRCARRHFDQRTAKRADYGFRCAADVRTRALLP